MGILSGKEITEYLHEHPYLVLGDYREGGVALYRCAKLMDFEVVDLESGEGSDRGAGDYAFLDSQGLSWGIERKWMNEFFGSVLSGRFEEQLAEMFLIYNGVILLLGGIDGRSYSKLAEVSRYIPLQLSIQKHGVDIVWFNNELDIGDAVSSVVSYHKGTHEAGLRRWARTKPTVYTTDPRVKKLLELWDGLPQGVAEKLIVCYNSPWRVLNAVPEELLSVEGVGKTRIERLYRSLGKELVWQERGRGREKTVVPSRPARLPRGLKRPRSSSL